MPTVQINLPQSVFPVLRKEPAEFVSELRIAAAVKWYELGDISQEKAAEIAGQTRIEFIQSLYRYKIDFMQLSATELDEELLNV